MKEPIVKSPFDLFIKFQALSAALKKKHKNEEGMYYRFYLACSLLKLCNSITVAGYEKIMRRAFPEDLALMTSLDAIESFSLNYRMNKEVIDEKAKLIDSVNAINDKEVKSKRKKEVTAIIITDPTIESIDSFAKKLSFGTTNTFSFVVYKSVLQRKDKKNALLKKFAEA